LSTISHVWKNGAVVTAEIVSDGGEQLVGLRIQGEDENMLTDIVLGEQEAISVAHALLGVVMYRLKDSTN